MKYPVLELFGDGAVVKKIEREMSYFPKEVLSGLALKETEPWQKLCIGKYQVWTLAAMHAPEEKMCIRDRGTMKVTVGGAEASAYVGNALVDDISMAERVYFYVYTEASNTYAGGWWCGDTLLTPGQWTRVTLAKELEPKACLLYTSRCV